jgi:uncharacterized protein (TIGR02301 family)
MKPQSGDKGGAMNIRIIAAALVLSLCAEAAAFAQTTEVEPGQATAPAPAPESLPPAYEEQMMRLAEILGSLHYLRELCGAKEGQLWRDEMQKLIEKEAPSDARRQRLIARFNRGFRGFREIYRECTPSAAEAANRYLHQGVRLAAEIPGRYGN